MMYVVDINFVDCECWVVVECDCECCMLCVWIDVCFG